MKLYCRTKKDVVQCVKDLLPSFHDDSPLTITINPVKLGGYSVRIAINTSLDDTGKADS